MVCPLWPWARTLIQHPLTHLHFLEHFARCKMAHKVITKCSIALSHSNKLIGSWTSWRLLAKGVIPCHRIEYWAPHKSVLATTITKSYSSSISIPLRRTSTPWHILHDVRKHWIQWDYRTATRYLRDVNHTCANSKKYCSWSKADIYIIEGAILTCCNCMKHDAQ